MGFYGNITNTSGTQFQFDKIYSNRASMEAGVNKDGIYVGRYILIEYDAKGRDNFLRVYKNGNKFYTSLNFEKENEIKYNPNLDNKQFESDGITNTEVGIGWIVYTNPHIKDEILSPNDYIEEDIYYICRGGKSGIAIFDQLTNKENAYKQNYNIDYDIYKKGYDSTVWVKSSVREIENGKEVLKIKYVQIAELNTVVPTFDLAVDAPSMAPITPHFDSNSTNVYYKLHIQPSFGLRVAAANGAPSDEQTYWTRLWYYPESGKSEKQYWNFNTSKWEAYEGNTIPSNGYTAAAIYYNEEAFTEYVNSSGNIEPEVKGDNYITITPTGKSGEKYNQHQTGVPDKEEIDTMEMRIDLRGVGNMMHKAWDIVHGPNRDDSPSESLQGRIDFFQGKIIPEDGLDDRVGENNAPKKTEDGIAVNEIPVQSVGKYLVGSVINGDNQYKGTDNFLDDTAILREDFNGDDAWIRTEINTEKQLEDSDYHRKGIAIHHTFHETGDTKSSSDLNTNPATTDEMPGTKEDKPTHRVDSIDLYTPKVDAAGHVVGKNIETVTLPYGFKTIATNGRGTSTAENASTIPSNSNIVAENTQDTLNINSGNKWIRMDTTASSDTLTIAHDIHETSSTTSTKTLVSETAATTFDVPTYSFDDAGHYLSHDTKTITVPYGYGKITGDSGSTSASATFDTLAIKADDAWIETTVSKDKVNITHTGPVTGTPVTVANVEPEFGETFSVTDWQYDSKGHKYDSTTHTVKIPDGSYTPANTATTHTDIITSLGFTPRTGAISSTKANTDTLTLYNYSANSGNLDIKATDTINDGLKKVQNHINSLDMSSVSTTDFITEITQIDGQVAVKRAKAGTLELGTDSTEKTVLGTDSLNQAINKIEARIKAEEENRKNAIDTLYGNNGEKIAETFDTIKEIADFLEQEDNDKQSGVEKIINDINANADAIEAEELRATLAETNLATNIATEEARAKGIEQTLTTNLNNEITRAKDAESTLTTNLNGEITRATNAENTLNTRITNLVGNTSVSTQIAAFGDTLGTAAKSDVNDFAPAGYYDDRVLTSVYEAKIASLEDTIAALEARIAALEPQPEPPVGE